MEPAPKLTGRSFEEQRTYKIEHFPGFDMVVNLDYPDASSINSLLRSTIVVLFNLETRS
jgi:glucose-6-phosphate 1-dehydrogenase